MASLGEIRNFEKLLSEETDVLQDLTSKAKVLKKGPRLDRTLRALEKQRQKVRFMSEQSKVMSDWTFSSANDYVPTDKRFSLKHFISLLALGSILFTIAK